MDEKTIYEHAAQLNRYFLNWRQAMFAGYFAILYGVVSLAMQACERTPEWVEAILGVAAIVGVAFVFAELRNRECYHRAASVAKAIELGTREKDGPKDLYHRMEDPPKRWPRKWIGPHSLVILGVYTIASLVLLAGALAPLPLSCFK